MIRLFHISDLHFGAEDRQALDWFAGLVEAEQPDLIVVTGDLTQQARRQEFEAATQWLQALGRPITVEVGNHDLPPYPIARFLRPYGRYETLERLVERPVDLPGVRIVPLKTTARFQWRLNWSKGLVSAVSLDRTLGMIEEQSGPGLTLVACHHPLIEGDTRMSSRTRGGAAALTALAEAGVDAVLSGHVHDPFDMSLNHAGRTIRLIGAGTLSERVRASRPSFNRLTIDDGKIDVVVQTMP
jgi:3',5'-cyclic AMP phosphodiesterase CpdA